MGNQRESYDEEFKRKTIEHMETENKRPSEIARELNILELQEENEILKKAMHFFTKDPR